MINNKLSSYIELGKVIRYLKGVLGEINVKLHENLITLLGCKMVGINIEELTSYKWMTNHYLIDSLGVDTLPSKNIVIKIFKQSKNYQKSIRQIEKFLNQELLNDNTESLYDENFEHTLDQLSSLIIEYAKNKKIIAVKNNYISKRQYSEFLDNGYLIIDSFLGEDQIKKLHDLTLYIAEEEKKRNVAYEYGGTEKKIQRIYNLISKHPCYVQLLELPIITEILEKYFHRDTLHHKYVLSSFQSNILWPGSEAQQLHIDGWGGSINSLPDWPVRLNINFLLTDWNKTNGATLICPGSHKYLRPPQKNEIPKLKLKQIIAPRGSIAVWTGHLWHKSGDNKSGDPRFGLFSCFAASHLKEVSTEEEHLEVVDKRVIDNLSEEMRFMIGLDRGVKKGALHRIDFANTKFKKMKL
tara:strand:- start:719 stop:1951 length:1233 start_codon:yes stop_codon:yes gene_type:complete